MTPLQALALILETAKPYFKIKNPIHGGAVVSTIITRGSRAYRVEIREIELDKDEKS